MRVAALVRRTIGGFVEPLVSHRAILNSLAKFLPLAIFAGFISIHVASAQVAGISPVVVQGSDGSLYLVLGGTKHSLTPQQVSDDQLSNWQDGAAFPDGVIPIAIPGSPNSDAAPTPTAQSAAEPQLTVAGVNAIQGSGADANTVWILGEVRNMSPFPAFGVSVSGRLLANDGSVAGANSTSFYYLPAGQAVGFMLSTENPSAYARVDVTAAADPSASHSNYAQLSITGTSLRKDHDQYNGDAVRLGGLASNNTPDSLEYAHLYIWFVDGQGNVVWAGDTYAQPATMAPGVTYAFDVRTIQTRLNPRVSSITEGRAYAFGRVRARFGNDHEVAIRRLSMR